MKRGMMSQGNSVTEEFFVNKNYGYLNVMDDYIDNKCEKKKEHDKKRAIENVESQNVEKKRCHGELKRSGRDEQVLGEVSSDKKNVAEKKNVADDEKVGVLGEENAVESEEKPIADDLKTVGDDVSKETCKGQGENEEKEILEMEKAIEETNGDDGEPPVHDDFGTVAVAVEEDEIPKTVTVTIKIRNDLIYSVNVV